MKLELMDFDLPTAIDNVLPLVRERAGRRSIVLETAVDARLGEVRADERKIRQVVLNLLSNPGPVPPGQGHTLGGVVHAVPRVPVALPGTGTAFMSLSL